MYKSKFNVKVVYQFCKLLNNDLINIRPYNFFCNYQFNANGRGHYRDLVLNVVLAGFMMQRIIRTVLFV